MNEQSELLKNIDLLDFSLSDIRLYLDTHPFDENALGYYAHYAMLKRKLEKEYASKYYPLSSQYAPIDKKWDWVLSPMPWENEANNICLCKGGN